MPIVSVILLMILLIGIGRHSKELGFRQYFVIFIITLVQVGIFAFYMVTIEKPPLFLP